MNDNGNFITPCYDLAEVIMIDLWADNIWGGDQ